jgi:hypothetical protein
MSRLPIGINIKTKTEMKAMLKQELADAAGVNLRTLHRWCQPYREELERMGKCHRDR